ncbi:major vault protein-like [Porites lutea]
MNNIVRIQPMQYVHLLDLNTNVTVLEVGPKSLILQDNHKLVEGPLPFVVIPPGHYCVIENPVKQPCEPGKQCDLKHGYREVRFFEEPFPLYPGETIEGAQQLAGYKSGIKALPVIGPNEGLQLLAIVDHVDGDEERKTGDFWQLEGPLTYKPTPYAEIVKRVKPRVIRHGQALRLKAKQAFVDNKGQKRVTSEEWLIRDLGAYLPGVFEEVVGVERAHTMTEEKALHMRAKQTCIDALGRKRNAGDEWLVTSDDAEMYIPEVSEAVVAEVFKTVLSRKEYCIVTDPIDSKGRNQLGKRELRKGVTSFFLHPGEDLDGGILNSYILEADEALVLSAIDHFDDDSAKKKCHRSPGDRWMIFGPTEYIPPIEVTVKSRRKAMPLCENEGIYVRDTQSGAVRAVMGPQSYLLKAYEELWVKELSEDVENILKSGGGIGSGDIRKMAYFESSMDPTVARKGGRDKTRVIVYRCPGNTAVQVYDYLRKTARVIFGPDLVVLGPHENFNVLSLSAGKPKKPNALKTICLMLGPDFITDIIEVETSDHARLKIKIAMNNFFEVERGNEDSEQAIFSVPDYIGHACKSVASRIRGMVAQVPFDEFHRYSTSVIKKAVFGVDKDGKIKQRLRFDANQLVVTNIDIQSIEPVDLHMSESLSKSVQMAIEISTKSIERAAEHEAKRTEQMAKGMLERQKLTNEKEAENARVSLFELRAITAAVESSGQKKAEAQAQAERLLIEGESAIEVAKLNAEAAEIELNAELQSQEMEKHGELEHQKQLNELELQKAKELAEIEANKFAAMVKAVGPKTISKIARSGPESQAGLLKGLGIQNVLITDGTTPLNLYQSPGGFMQSGMTN